MNRPRRRPSQFLKTFVDTNRANQKGIFKLSDTVLILNKKHCMRDDIDSAVRQIRAEGHDIAVRIPWEFDDIIRIFDHALSTGTRRVIAAGGDGTVNTVINLIVDRKAQDEIELSLLPLGTANDFARGTDIPVGDPVGALRLACSGSAQAIDVGIVNGRHFVNVASGGIGAEITSTTPSDLKRMLGGAAYSLMGLVKASELTPYEAKVVTSDGDEEGKILLVSIGNSRFAGGGFDVAPKASLIDGLLDLAVVTTPKDGDLDTLVDELADPFNEANKVLHYRQLNECVIETKQPLPMNLDGEPTLDTRFEFKIKPKCIKMVLGQVF
ncbi:MAG: lipid kinase YegS [Hoeflea sp.]|uniref:lipid kinase YegS n=1 Tax=Hoeflea sp. TaxID=1940281 RepID=UPI003297B967